MKLVYFKAKENFWNWNARLYWNVLSIKSTFSKNRNKNTNSATKNDTTFIYLRR